MTIKIELLEFISDAILPDFNNFLIISLLWGSNAELKLINKIRLSIEIFDGNIKFNFY